MKKNWLNKKNENYFKLLSIVLFISISFLVIFLISTSQQPQDIRSHARENTFRKVNTQTSQSLPVNPSPTTTITAPTQIPQKTNSLPPAPDGYKWQLTFNDEFSGTTIDKSKWYQWATHVDQGRLYRPEDSYLDGNGNLIIRTIFTRYNNQGIYTASSIATTGKFEQKYGYFESRVLFPNKSGVVPAFWLHTFNMDAPNYSNPCCEIDVFEQLGRNDNFQTTIHWGGYGTSHASVNNQFKDKGILSGWHTFGFWWKSDVYIFYLDGVEFWRTNANGHVSQVPQFVWFSQYPNSWAGGINLDQVPALYKVDFVRVYNLIPSNP